MSKAPDIKQTVSITRTYQAEVPAEVMEQLVRKFVGAPDDARVDHDQYANILVMWAETSREEGR